MDTTTFAGRLKLLKERRRMTGRALAAAAEVSYQAISRMEHGHYEPSLIVASRLAQALGCTVGQLAGLEPLPPG